MAKRFLHLILLWLSLAGFWDRSAACLGGSSNGNDEESRIEDNSFPRHHPEPMIAESELGETSKVWPNHDSVEKIEKTTEIDEKIDLHLPEIGRKNNEAKVIFAGRSEAATTQQSSTVTTTSKDFDERLVSTGKATTVTTSTSTDGVTTTVNNTEAPKDEELMLSPRVVQAYLREFGYLSKVASDHNDSERLANDSEYRTALQQFQVFFGVQPATGKLDFLTTEQMLHKRCANPDVNREDMTPKIWQRSALKWHLETRNSTTDWLPKSIGLEDLRELIREAFSAWEIVISMEFAEELTNVESADIVFTIGDQDDRGGKSQSGLGIASGTSPEKSRIWLKRDENWSTFQVQEENKIDIFLVLIHEIGHALGLDHSHDSNSVMFPALERKVGAQLPVISNDDVDRLRALYDPDDDSNASDDIGTFSDTSFSNGTLPSMARKCPTALWAAAQVWPHGDLFVFLDVNVWRFDRNRRLVNGPTLVSEMFPDAPPYAAVAVSAEGLLVLIRERTLYGYTVEETTGKIQTAAGYPKDLHSRVLFYPEAAFPLANGSVILLRDDVFATYDLVANEPSMLNDKNVVFPNLPTGLRAGIFAGGSPVDGVGSDYWMMTADTIVDYRIAQAAAAGGAKPLAQFLNCEDRNVRTANEASKKHQIDGGKNAAAVKTETLAKPT